MKNRFKDDFYLEIMPHDFDDQRMLNIEIIVLANDHSVPLIATNDTHFVYPEWAETQRIAKMMATNLTFSKVEEMKARGEEPPYMAELNPNLFLCSRQDMMKWFAQYHPDLDKWAWNSAITNTGTLAQTIKPFMLDRTIKMPKVTPTPKWAEVTLRSWVEEGFDRICDEYPQGHWEKYSHKEYGDRIEFEWKVLKESGAIPYMVMVADIVRWAKTQQIVIGLGRGSAAGCLISYLVGITAVDPIPWGLLFERFLNPGRKGMPDIDIDVQSGKRHLVKEYVIDKYGADHVADIITHERFQPKSVLQRLCKAFDVPYVEAKKVTDTIDIRQDDEETTLEELLPINESLREFKGKYPNIWEHATRLEGSVANFGKHAAGVVITPNPIVDYMALERGKKGDLVTSWSDSAEFMVISDHGFQKIDFLGIAGLERHDYACKLIEQRHGRKIDLNKLSPLRDPLEVEADVMQMFTDGFTIGVFQFASKGMTSLMRQIKPDNLLDLTAANALYRPGPMNSGVTWDYGRIKRGDKEPPEWAYQDDLVWEVLKETYGLVAYQEQVMEIGKRMGDFTPAQADDLRKAMGKLYRIKGGKAAREFMQQYRQLWIAGCKKRKIDNATRDLVWDQILGFGGYGFNKSHAGSYSLLGYQDQWLKTNFPLEFYASILTYPSGSSPQAKTDFMRSVVREARSRGLKFLSPDVNRSQLGWTIDKENGIDGLRFGLTGIKDVGEVAAARIVKMREETYPDGEGFADLEDLRRLCGSKVNKKVIEAMTEAGGFDCFGMRDTWSGSEIARCEKERLRMVIKGTSESDKYAKLIKPNIFTQEEVETLPQGSEVIVGGEITKFEKKKTKNGNDFANAVVTFEMNEWRVKLWEQQLHQFEDYLVLGNTVMVSGKKDEWNGFISVVAKNVCGMAEMAAEIEYQAELEEKVA
jgi:DNA polymerase-3 subunit alpha